MKDSEVGALEQLTFVGGFENMVGSLQGSDWCLVAGPDNIAQRGDGLPSLAYQVSGEVGFKAEAAGLTIVCLGVSAQTTRENVPFKFMEIQKKSLVQ